MSGSTLGALEHSEASLNLLKAIEARSGWALAMDTKGRIRHQYEEKIKHGFGKDWLRRLATTNRILFIKCQNVDKGTRTALKEAHFDTEDFKYVDTAASTSSKKLVSHDPDYSPKVRKALKRISVSVLSAAEGLQID